VAFTPVVWAPLVAVFLEKQEYLNGRESRGITVRIQRGSRMRVLRGPVFYPPFWLRAWWLRYPVLYRFSDVYSGGVGDRIATVAIRTFGRWQESSSFNDLLVRSDVAPEGLEQAVAAPMVIRRLASAACQP
jgi:hypothetical protein